LPGHAAIADQLFQEQHHSLAVAEAIPGHQAVFRHKFFDTLTKYYEEIQSMSGAGGRPKPKHFKRTMIADEEAAGGGEPIEEAAAEADDNAPPPPPPPAAADAAPATPATEPPLPQPRKGEKGMAVRVGQRHSSE
jgi:hypothetical protein